MQSIQQNIQTDKPQFEPARLYYSVFNREAVQGSILNRHEVDAAGWYAVVSLSPLVLETVAGPVEVAADSDPRLVVKRAVYEWQLATGQIAPKAQRASRTGKPSKRINYAAQVLARGA